MTVNESLFFFYYFRSSRFPKRTASTVASFCEYIYYELYDTCVVRFVIQYMNT